MKLYRAVPVFVLLFVFTFTNIASAYSAPSLATLTTQLQGLLVSLSSLLGFPYELTAATVASSVSRTCQVTVVTKVNGEEVTATTTMTGISTDLFAIAFSIGAGASVPTTDLPYSELVQKKTWGKASTTATAGYFTPADYQQRQQTLTALASDSRYKVLAVALDNVNDKTTGTIFSSSTPYAEALISNDAIGTDIPADKVSVRVNIMSCTGLNGFPSQNTNKPNIVFVQVDDLDMQVMSKLPRLKALMADSGMTFENNFTSFSLPASTLTGTYAHNTGGLAGGVNSQYANLIQSGKENNTIAVWLQNAGYRTALMGKYMNGYDSGAPGVTYAVPAGWTEFVSPIGGNPYSQYNYTLNVNGSRENHYLTNCTDEQAKATSCNDYATPQLADKQAHFMLNVLSKRAKEYVTSNAETGTPFFLYLTPFTPHTPTTLAPRFESYLASTTWVSNHRLITTSAFNESAISDKSTWLVNNAPLLASSSLSAFELLYQKRLISMYAIEDMMTNLVATLRENNQLDNTYIIFTSDNGFHQGQHRLASGKGTAFETDIKVPLFIRGPRVVAASTTAVLSSNVDIAPTIAAFANVTVPTPFDGRSLEGVLQGTAVVAPRQAVLLEHGTSTLIRTRVNTPSVPPGYTWNYARSANSLSTSEPMDTTAIDPAEHVGEYRGIRTLQYTYIKYLGSDEEELYDNVNDPDQLYNVALYADAALLQRLRTWTADLMNCAGQACRTVESQNRLNGLATVGLDGKACFAGTVQVNNGTTRTLYRVRTVEPGLSCTAQKQDRTCVDGKLTGSPVYTSNSCTVLERFTGVNMNHNPQDLDLSLMNETNATWMRAIFDTVKYASSSTYNFENWAKFMAARALGKKGVVNIMWDFEPNGEHVPLPNSPREQQLFTYLESRVLPALLPVADIIVNGNEPFKDTYAEDWVYTPSLGGSPIAVFYKRATDRIQTYIQNHGGHENHKLYLGAFTQLYSPIGRITKVPGRPDVIGATGQAVDEMLKFAASSPAIDGIDFHTHILTVQQIEDSLDYISRYTDKPVTDTEYSYAQAQGFHLTETLDAGDTRPFGGATFSATTLTTGGVQKYSGTTTVINYLLQAQRNPVTKTEWDNFFRSRSWTINNFILKADEVFRRYPVNGVTFGLIQAPVNADFPLPWYMNSLYSSRTVQHLPGGAPQGNYQYLEDFQSLQ